MHDFCIRTVNNLNNFTSKPNLLLAKHLKKDSKIICIYHDSNFAR